MSQIEPEFQSGIPPTVIDRAALQQMSRDLGSAIVCELLTTFNTDLQKRQHNLLHAINQGDVSAIASEAHTLKSSSASCGLIDFSTLMRHIEEAATDGQLDKARQLGERVPAAAADAKAALAMAQKELQGGSAL